jgi:hypothetical protein
MWATLAGDVISIWVKSLSKTSQWQVNKVKDKRFYTNEVLLAEDFSFHDNAYWQSHRPESLSEMQLRTYDVIDTLVEIPRMKSFVEFVKLATTGYWRRGKGRSGALSICLCQQQF